MKTQNSGFTPFHHQPEYDLKRSVKELSPSAEEEELEVDVLVVGGGPAGLSAALHLKQLCQKDFPNVHIAVMEKASRMGGHSLSGAVINPAPFKKLFPDLHEKDFPFHRKVKKESFYFLTKNYKWPLPFPPPMKNKNFYTASLTHVVKWMARRAEDKQISLFTSFTADKLLVEKGRIKGVSTFPVGLNRDGKPGTSHQKPVHVKAKLLILADGSRGHLSQAWQHLKKISSTYPSTYALGVKEVWEVACPLTGVFHTMGWPLPLSCFGGSWLYPLEENKVSLGLVAGLNSSFKNLDVHLKLQELKTHPFFASVLKGGRCVEWGAKTIPEGGYHSMPHQLSDHGLLLVGDAAHMVNVPALKGIHYAMTAGLLAAETAFEALKKNDFSHPVLKHYDEQVRYNSCIGKELYPVRNVRQAFDSHFLKGVFKSALMFLSGGRFPGDQKARFCEDAKKVRFRDMSYAKPVKGLSKSEAVFLSGNKSRDDIPSHLKSKEDLPEEVKDFYTHLCPAGVYEKTKEGFFTHPPNCVDCKATDVLGPRWTPKEGGTGPDYRQM